MGSILELEIGLEIGLEIWIGFGGADKYQLRKKSCQSKGIPNIDDAHIKCNLQKSKVRMLNTLPTNPSPSLLTTV